MPAVTGRHLFTIKGKDRKGAGLRTGERDVVETRNVLTPRKLETLREKFRACVLQAAEALVTAVQIFDAKAPRVQPRREISTRQVKVTETAYADNWDNAAGNLEVEDCKSCGAGAYFEAC
ncbi:hypothetical protein [Asticcacaulis excentricus]|nr:hypothetical protein [Asticcacaulis excentricus]